MVHGKQITLSSQGFSHIHDITAAVREIVNESPLQDGIACVFNVGSTGTITTMEYEPALVQDVQEQLEKYLPSSMQGFGAVDMSAERAVRNAIQSEVRKSMSGMGDFLTKTGVDDDLSMQGMGDFVTSSEVDSAASVSGLTFGAESGGDIYEAVDFDYE